MNYSAIHSFLLRALCLAALLLNAAVSAADSNPADRIARKNERLRELGPLAKKLPLAVAEQVRQLRDKKITAGNATRALRQQHGALLAPAPAAAPDQLTMRVSATVTDELLKQIKQTGATIVSSAPQWNSVLIQASLEQIAALSDLENVKLRMNFAPRTRTQGVANNGGDIAMKSDQIRGSLNVTGAGFKIGVVSNSINDTGAVGGTVSNGVLVGSNPQNSGDLPTAIEVLDRGPGSGTDEGAAMLELIHDVAPGAPLAFASCGINQAVFAQNLSRLGTAANCRITVDDIAFFDEPFFQDGPIAQAIAANLQKGVVHFTAAGNDADHGVAANFLDIDPGNNTRTPFGAEFHDWGGGIGAFLPINIPAGEQIFVLLQWNQPFDSYGLGDGARSDLDLLLYNAPTSNLANLVAVGGEAQGNTNSPDGDPVEALSFTNTTGATVTRYLAVDLYHGVRNNFMRVVVIGPATFPAGGMGAQTIYGHSAAADAVSVGAVFYADVTTGGAQGPDVGNINVESFSSKGGIGAAGIPFYFDTAGNALAGGPVRRSKPDICAPDGVNTTFFGSSDFEGDPFLNFYGTSAAAPNAAAAAALIWEQSPALSATQLINLIKSSARDIVANNPLSSPGADAFAGNGLIDAVAATVSGSLARFVVTAPSGGAVAPQTAGVAFPIRITACDQNNITVSTFAAAVTLSADGTINAGGGVTAAFSNGRLASHSLTFNTARTFALTVTGGIVASNAELRINPAALHNFLVESADGGEIPEQTAFAPFSIRLVARDQFNNTATQFLGNVALTSNGTFLSGGGTSPIFSGGILAAHDVAFVNAGSFHIRATQGLVTSTSNTFTVKAGALQVTSGPTATPNPAVAGQPVQFIVTGNMPNVSWSWNFGDGSPFGSGATPTHTYSTTGIYTARVTGTDALFGQTVSAEVSVVVILGVSSAGNDADNDGFIDEVETDLGSDPNDANSTPLDLDTPIASTELNVLNLRVKQNANGKTADSVQLNGTLPVPASFNPSGQKLIVFAGGVAAPFTLDARGNGKTGKNRFKLSMRRGLAAAADQVAAFNARLVAGGYTLELLEEELRTELRTLDVVLYFDGQRFEQALTRRYRMRFHR